MALLRRETWQASATRVHRLWRREGLKVPQQCRKQRALVASAHACHKKRAERMNDVWCWDVEFDRTTSGSPLRWLSIVDERTRECLMLKVDRGNTSEDVIDRLAELFAIRGLPRAVRSDNGPELIAAAIQSCLAQLDVQTKYVAPGSPWQNSYAESFKNRLRDEFLAREEFESVTAARRLTSAWREDYNHHRPHSSLGYLTPGEFASNGHAEHSRLLGNSYLT